MIPDLHEEDDDSEGHEEESVCAGLQCLQVFAEVRQLILGRLGGSVRRHG